MTSRPSLQKRIAAALPLLAAVACADAPVATPSHALLHATVAPEASVAATGLLKAVHASAARFNSTTQATRAGYAEASPCISHPTLGAMGFHWVNQGLVDPTFDPYNPEALVYAPDAQGNIHLAAVEYIVINVGQPAPTFDGQAFDVGGTPVPVAHWSLHVWAYEDNPSGTFFPWNPNVSCTP